MTSSNALFSNFQCAIHFLLLCFVIGRASTPTAANTVNLPLNDVNIVVLTDVHSWVGGHNVHHEPSLNSDYGHVVSFVELLKQQAPDHDFFFVMNGDFNDGTGLSVPYPPSHLTQILKFMPWDAMNIGNHEHYYDVNIQHITQAGGLVEHFGERYLTSNSVMADTGEPIGSRYTYLKGTKNADISILAFGFLYNFDEHCNLTDVEHVQDVVASDWFVNELTKGDYNAILFLAHMDVEDPLVHVLLNATRGIVGDGIPIQFITGHTHYRGYASLDANAASFEAGRYLDTVGFVSFPVMNAGSDVDLSTNSTSNATTPASSQFEHVFLDANLDTLKATLGVDDMTTSSGSALSSLIQQTRQDLGLNQIVGCSPQHYYLERTTDRDDSLFGLYLREVVLKTWFRYNTSKVLIQGTGSFRYDLFAGNVSMDDVIAVSPFTDTMYQVSEHTKGSDILKAFGPLLNVTNKTISGHTVQLSDYGMSGTIHPDAYYDLYTKAFSIPLIQESLQNATDGNFSFTPIQQYHDDGSAMTAASLWLDFIDKHWSCESQVAVNNRWMFVVFSVAACVVFVGFRLWRSKQRNKERQGYDNAVVLDEEDDTIL